jgi:hypothetical protein
MHASTANFANWISTGRRSIRIALWSIATVAVIYFAANSAAAQANRANVPTVVQLPTFHFFTVDTTVLVPDGGDAFLGGVNSGSAASQQSGIPGLGGRPFTNSAMASSAAASGVSVSAQIHDFDAMDKALLGGEAQGFAFHPPLTLPPQLSAALAPSATDSSRLQSVAAIRSQQAAQDAASDHLAATDLARGQELLSVGKTGVAIIYFQTAARESSPTNKVHRQALAALANAEKAKITGSVAGAKGQVTKDK